MQALPNSHHIKEFIHTGSHGRIRTYIQFAQMRRLPIESHDYLLGGGESAYENIGVLGKYENFYNTIISCFNSKYRQCFGKTLIINSHLDSNHSLHIYIHLILPSCYILH